MDGSLRTLAGDRGRLMKPSAPERAATTMASPMVVTPESTGPEWDAYVDAHPEATAYHPWRWRRVFETGFGHRAVYLAARSNRRVVGVLPLVCFNSWLFGRFVVSLPFVNYGGVLADDLAGAQTLLEQATAVAAKLEASHLELRHRSRQFAALPAKYHKVAMQLTLAPDARTMWDRFDGKVRNQIRKAEKSGLTASSGGRELLDEFYPVFASNMRDLGTPVYGRRFFAAILDELPDSTRIVLVRAGARCVAGAVTVAFRQTLEVPWAASLWAYRTSCPNNLLYWTIIQEATAAGLRSLDFGRSTPDGGTFRFKRQWGAQPAPLCWEYGLLARTGVPDQSPANPKFRTAIALWKRLPLRVTTLLGPRIVRSIP